MGRVGSRCNASIATKGVDETRRAGGSIAGWRNKLGLIEVNGCHVSMGVRTTSELSYIEW